ncbi:amidohydrolase family protein [Halomonas stenophila]|uniref:Cytosine/adenosine deaminase-related metal-dependent hydrolase n=1 Tax=Halomonas stenophila TaxID=795312 RepID=A0A7W5EV92_9GAMM|nr:amidohydrolase family protein [Halomonas stenophila]MBB3231450.1 cytosine/adenosine deaminase-related metal-dependent hydrolase [Halomonas stenophila]
MTRTMITGRYVIGYDGTGHEILHNGEVVYDNDTIVHVGFGYDGPLDHRIDAGNAVVGPGFIDLDALADLDSTVLGFDNAPGWRHGRVWASTYVARGPRDVYTPEEEDAKKRYAFAQLLLNGITTALPITSLLYREWGETYQEFARAAAIGADYGLRLYLGPAYRTGASVIHPDGRFDIHWDEPRGMRGLEEAIEFVKDYDGRANGLIRGMLAPDRIECCTRDLLERTADAARSLGCPVRLHCCQSPLEVETVAARFGQSSLALLDELGFLDRQVLLPHGIYLGGQDPTDDSVERDLVALERSKATLVHCPLVSARMGHFMDSLATMQRRGIKVGLGTDTYPPDIVTNMHTGIMATRMIEGSESACSAADYYNAATLGGAKALNRPDLGRLSPGARADITVFDLSGFHLGQFVDPIQTMIMNGSGRDFSHVIVNGRTIVKDRQLPGVNLEKLAAEAQQQFDRLRASYPERTHLHPPAAAIFPTSFPSRSF